MTDNTHDDAALIETLRGLTPTEGVWKWVTRYGETYLGAMEIGGGDVGLVAYGHQHSVEVDQPDDATLIAAAPAMRALILRQADELAALKAQLVAADQPAPTEWVSGESKPCPDCERLGERARSLSGWNKPAPRLAGDGPL